MGFFDDLFDTFNIFSPSNDFTFGDLGLDVPITEANITPSLSPVSFVDSAQDFFDVGGTTLSNFGTNLLSGAAGGLGQLSPNLAENFNIGNVGGGLGSVSSGVGSVFTPDPGGTLGNIPTGGFGRHPA